MLTTIAVVVAAAMGEVVGEMLLLGLGRDDGKLPVVRFGRVGCVVCAERFGVE